MTISRAKSLSQHLAFAAAVSIGLGGCGDAPATEVADRVWISMLPTSPRDSFNAVVLTERGGKGLGAFFNGSVYRGGYDVFTWKTQGVGRYNLELLQTKAKHELRAEPCSPSPGFDYCMRLIGDPSGTVRYQSRKRWTLRRKAKDAAHFPETLADEMQAVLAEAGISDDAKAAPDEAEAK